MHLLRRPTIVAGRFSFLAVEIIESVSDLFHFGWCAVAGKVWRVLRGFADSRSHKRCFTSGPLVCGLKSRTKVMKIGLSLAAPSVCSSGVVECVGQDGSVFLQLTSSGDGQRWLRSARTPRRTASALRLETQSWELPDATLHAGMLTAVSSAQCSGCWGCVQPSEEGRHSRRRPSIIELTHVPSVLPTGRRGLQDAPEVKEAEAPAPNRSRRRWLVRCRNRSWTPSTLWLFLLFGAFLCSSSRPCLCCSLRCFPLMTGGRCQLRKPRLL